MPQNSQAYIYGSMAEENFSYSASNLLFCQKTITHLIGGAWLKSQPQESQKQLMDIISKDLSSGGEIFGINVVNKYPIEDFQKAVDEYRKYASEGKVIIVPNST